MDLQRETITRPNNHTLIRQVTITPAMCGDSSRFIGQIGDWTWETVSNLCEVNAFGATDALGNPTYLSFYFYQVLGDREFHLHTPTFGDRLQVVSACFDFGSESILTLHRIAKADRELSPVLTPDELHNSRYPGCLYVQNFNRWIRRGSGGNIDLQRASPVGFAHAHLPKVPAEYSPRLAYDAARRHGFFSGAAEPKEGDTWTVPYEVDVAHDLNGVGLLYFASYFSIVDRALVRVWRDLGRTDRSFLCRIVGDVRFCFLANVEPGARLSVHVQRSIRGTPERFDVRLVEHEIDRPIAVAALGCWDAGL